MSGILRLESLTKGNTLRQGDLTLLKYRLFDADGDNLDISGKSATVRLMKDNFTFIAYEKEGLTVAPDDTISFNVNKILPAGLYHLEVIVDDKYIFPSRDDEGKINIDKSSFGADITIVETAGVEAVARKATSMMKQDEEFIDDMIENVISDTSVGNIEEYYNQFNEVIDEFTDLKPRALSAISKSDDALSKSQNALNVANGIDAKATNALNLSESADTLSKSVQEQFNQVVIDGDSSVESAQARVDANGVIKQTLKQRLDDDYTEVTTQLAETALSVSSFGTKGDGTDDSVGLNDALEAVKSGGRLIFDQKGTYRLMSNIQKTLTGDVELDFNGAKLIIDDTFLLTLKGETITTTTLTTDALLSDNKITVANVAGLKIGDIVYVTNSTITETAWSTNKRFTSSVVAIAGNTVTLKDKLHFDFNVSEAGNSVTFARPRRIKIKNATIKAESLTNRSQFKIEYLIYDLDNVKIDSTDDAYVFELTKCIDSHARNIEVVSGGYYPFLVNTCRNVKFKELNHTGKELRHMVAFGAWSADCYVDGLRGLGGLVESHPAFNVNYENVDITTTTVNTWNLRSVGGSLKRMKVRHIGEPPIDTLTQSLQLTDERLWSLYNFVMDDVTLDVVAESSDVTATGVIGIRHGRDVTIQNCTFPEGTILSIGTTTRNGGTTEVLRLYNNRGLKSVTNREENFKIITDNPTIPPTLNEGVYEIYNTLKTVVRDDAGTARWKDDGIVVANKASESPLIIPLKIYPQNKDNSVGFNEFGFKIKLTGMLRHASSGSWDMVEKTYFGYMSVNITGSKLTTEPISTSAPTGIPNADLTLSVGEATFYAVGEPNGLNHYLAFDVTLTSERPSKKFSLLYDIEYFGYR